MPKLKKHDDAVVPIQSVEHLPLRALGGWYTVKYNWSEPKSHQLTQKKVGMCGEPELEQARERHTERRGNRQTGTEERLSCESVREQSPL